MNRADVNRALPELCPEKVEAVVRKLGKLGIKCEDDFKYLKETDLTEGEFLKVVEARKLISAILKSGNDNLGLYFESIYYNLKTGRLLNLFSIT